MKLYDTTEQYKTITRWVCENGFSARDLPLTATTDHGEECLVDFDRDENEEIIWKITTFQKNGWAEVCCYHKDGTTETLYDR